MGGGRGEAGANQGAERRGPRIRRYLKQALLMDPGKPDFHASSRPCGRHR